MSINVTAVLSPSRGISVGAGAIGPRRHPAVLRPMCASMGHSFLAHKSLLPAVTGRRQQRLQVQSAGPQAEQKTESGKGTENGNGQPPKIILSDMAHGVKDQPVGPDGRKLEPENSSKDRETRKQGLITAADKRKEESRRYRRTIFGFEQWREHRSTSRYLRHITGVAKSGIARGLSGPLWTIATIGVLVGTYESLLEAGQLPAGWGSISLVNASAFNYSSFALSLLLVFRTNSSYARWAEARAIWGSVVNRSRDVMRQANTYWPEEDPELLALTCRWMMAFSASLKVHLREDSDLDADLKDILRPEELNALRASAHRPNFVLSMLSSAAEEANCPAFARVRYDENLTSFADAAGACERILKTPIPLSYTRHTSRFLIVYVFFMPFTLWHACGWGMVPASVAISFLLLGIEEIGVQIEEPFAILPLEGICSTIATNLREMHAKRNDVKRLVSTVIRPSGQGARARTKYDPEEFL
eukprot:CAMPEP_0206135050 /NCGR_PEP_ID=MMETSP1473-20131121/412_1 /ASSEMBLY_ACC=CAM_ASM_001109 /TAXON_ID=1461547 /ORGANISM="Stichococcus sp, Strain RCC1054" /LENGTH=473 /DNA_ID=CAMNT_0053526755 /DNA_START=327 /DNA_END=1748 /DNA_ORIENTATION=-